MMEKYFYTGCWTQELGDQLATDPVFPLVRELNFAHKYVVLCRDLNERYVMVDTHGLAVGNVFISKDGGVHKDQTTYNFRTPYFPKERGIDQLDRTTYGSVKVSTLMGALKRKGVFNKEFISQKLSTVGKSAKNRIDSSLGDDYKSHTLSSSEVQSLIAHYLGVNTDVKLATLDPNKCKIELDKMIEVDKIVANKAKTIQEFFCNGFYQAGIDAMGHLLVGKFKATIVDGLWKQETIEPFKRYINPMDYSELVPMFTMTRLAYEDRNVDKTVHGIFPIKDEYNKELNAVFYRDNRPSTFDHQWMFTPV